VATPSGRWGKSGDAASWSTLSQTPVSLHEGISFGAVECGTCWIGSSRRREVGITKPDPRIFSIALAHDGCNRDQPAMLGDS
jgi:hypothetical protein